MQITFMISVKIDGLFNKRAFQFRETIGSLNAILKRSKILLDEPHGSRNRRGCYWDRGLIRENIK